MELLLCPEGQSQGLVRPVRATQSTGPVSPSDAHVCAGSFINLQEKRRGQNLPYYRVLQVKRQTLVK